MPSLHIHLLGNLVLIALIYFFDKELRKEKNGVLYLFLAVMGSNLIDIDHLLANPIYDASRCSINFHPLHSWYSLPIWVVGIIGRNKYLRYFCFGVLLHLVLDGIDCLV